MKLSLRELFLLVVIAAMGCGWWLDQARISRERAALEEQRAALEERRDKFYEWAEGLAGLLGESERTLNTERVKLGMKPVVVYLPGHP